MFAHLCASHWLLYVNCDESGFSIVLSFEIFMYSGIECVLCLMHVAMVTAAEAKLLLHELQLPKLMWCTQMRTKCYPSLESKVILLLMMNTICALLVFFYFYSERLTLVVARTLFNGW